MSANTWTPTALASEARTWQGSGWRAVEAQHRVATMNLVHGEPADQVLLEDLLDAVKPPSPRATQTLHWLLATPFRYRALSAGSRFRRRGDPGVFYGGESRRTACAEAGYWRLRFWTDSAALAQTAASVEMTLFEFHARTPRLLDLTLPPLAARRADWIAQDYGATQALAAAAREAGVEAIRYESARDAQGRCLALLAPAVFDADSFRHVQQTWTLSLRPPQRIVWQRPLERETLAFEFPARFAGDSAGSGPAQ